MTLRLTILGAPRTKKTHNEAAISLSHPGRDGKLRGQPCPRCGARLRASVYPSTAWRQWIRDARLYVDGTRPLVRLKLPSGVMTFERCDPLPASRFVPIDREVNCRALFYRDARRGDLLGYQQGLADLLQEWEVITNDRLIVGWDGSRMLTDRDRPRVDVELTSVTG